MNKAEKDYSINEELFHWQSRSRTTEDSGTGQRYLTQASNGGNDSSTVPMDMRVLIRVSRGEYRMLQRDEKL
ncbi:MAG: hypothetical protein M0Z55_08895 [Peptococcaceae bacterium]|nr:hypothetical protein [Peptococcaceae bacterium]